MYTLDPTRRRKSCIIQNMTYAEQAYVVSHIDLIKPISKFKGKLNSIMLDCGILYWRGGDKLRRSRIDKSMYDQMRDEINRGARFNLFGLAGIIGAGAIWAVYRVMAEGAWQYRSENDPELEDTLWWELQDLVREEVAKSAAEA